MNLPRSWRNGGTRLLVDVAPPTALSAAAVHELLYNDSGWIAWLLAAAIIWPLLWRRRAPVPIFAISLLVAVVLWATRTVTVADLAVLVALYTVAARRSFRTALLAAGALEAVLLLAAFRFAPMGSIDDAVILLNGLAAAALFLGTTMRAKRRYLAALEDRAHRLEVEQAQAAQLAAAAERTRIAREMHDIVAHGLSVVITLAEGAAASAVKDPAAARPAMQQAAAAGRQSLNEMRKLLDVLRTENTAERGPQPDLSSVDHLIDDIRRTGLTVQMHQQGDATALSRTAQATLYRIVQEALTNILKHARDPSTVTVDLDYQPDTAHFLVHDDGRGTTGLTSASRPGNGLTGMRERVTIFGGTLQAGPDPQGWMVRGNLQLH